jgi:hypothetical protein
MGRITRLVGLSVIGAIVVPAVAAAMARRNLVSEGDEASDTLKLYAIFDGVQLASRAGAFQGGDAIAWYGGLDLDLREATLDPAGARMRAMAIFGGTRIIVPEDWAVEVHGRPFLGGVTTEADGVEASDGRPRLVVDATAVFGGVDITTHGDIEDAISGRIAREQARRGGPTEAFERAENEAAAEAEAAVEEAQAAVEEATAAVDDATETRRSETEGDPE